MKYPSLLCGKVCPNAVGSGITLKNIEVALIANGSKLFLTTGLS
jgi:hypothetical protein